jgi:hypothetical protein
MRKLVAALLLFGMLPVSVFASTTDGTIDSTNKYAKGIDANVGKINLGLTAGNVHVTDALLTGYAWSALAGWINFAPTTGGVTNNAEGTLGGYAWGQNSGWINFAPTHGGVTIDTSGVFHGYAWSQNLGWISFNCLDNSSCGTDSYSVVTDWRPLSTRPPTGGGSGSGGTGGGGGGSSGTPAISTPSVSTYSATAITTVSAALNGYVNPNGSTDTVRWFEWGTSPVSLVNSTTHYSHGAVADGFADTISGLAQNTPYYFRVVAQNSHGIVAGFVLNFTVLDTGAGTGGTGTGGTGTGGAGTGGTGTGGTGTGGPGTGGGATGGGSTGGGTSGGGSTGGGSTGGGGGEGTGGGGGTGGSGNPIAEQIQTVISNIVPPGARTTFNNSVVLAAAFVDSTTASIRKFSDTPIGAVTTKSVVSAGVVGGGTVAAVAAAGNIASFSDLSLMFFRLWSLLLVALGFKKKHMPWGTVYDSVTKQPLDPAYVVLADPAEKEAGTAITDLDGRFGFLVPPGSYHIIANKTNYSFPSKKLVGQDHDALYDNLYFGGEVPFGGNDVITKNIPMDPEAFDWNEFAKRDKKLMMFYTRNTRILTTVSTVLFYAGLVSAAVLALARPDRFNIAIVAIYGVLLLLRAFGLKPKAYGSIIDAQTKEPLSFAVVRVFQKGVDRELFHRVTDQYGRYYALLSKGEYYVTIERKNPDESYTSVYKSGTINAKNGIINENFHII